MNLLNNYVNFLNENANLTENNFACVQAKKKVEYWNRALQIANNKFKECNKMDGPARKKCSEKWTKNIAKLKESLKKFQLAAKSKC